MTLRRLHRLNAVALIASIVLHFGNHLIGLSGIENHVAVMEALRKIYRTQVVEIIIVGLFTVQMFLGIKLVLSRGKPASNWAWLQVLSGLYIVFFLLQHMGTIVFMRFTNDSLDTNFYFAASVVLAKPMGWYFTVYYALGIFAVFAHIAAALHFRNPKNSLLPANLLATGTALSLVLSMMLSGVFYPIELPVEYKELISETYPAWLVSKGL